MRPLSSLLARRNNAKTTPLWVSWSQLIVDSMLFITFTTILTVYALFGSDVKLLVSDKPVDMYFDGVTIGCLVVFSVEILLCTLGKDDYFLSFFMILDVISTVTLVLDLTSVKDLIAGDEEDLSNIRGSRTATIGARATRLVRVIRLVRIIKLYKAVYEANQAKKRRAARQANPGDDEDDWDDMDVGVQQMHQESRVGKKLSELTTRRVIVLVLTMLLLHKLLHVDTSRQFKTSADYGADVINQAFEKLLENPDNETVRLKYEHSLLQFVYYHNWYVGHLSECPSGQMCSNMYDSQLFWFGIVGEDAAAVRAKAEVARMRPSTVAAWVADVAAAEATDGSMRIFSLGSLPSRIEALLGQPIAVECNLPRHGTFRLGVPLIGVEDPDWNVHYAVHCPEDLRREEQRKYAAALLVLEERFRYWHIAFYFDTRPFVFWDAIFSLMVVIYVCIALCVASLMFSNDANRLVLHPVENMIAKVEAIRANPLSAMKVADEEFKVEEMNRAKARKTDMAKRKSPLWLIHDLIFFNSKAAAPELMETVILEKTIIKLGSLLALGFGQAGAQIIEHNMKGIDSACVDAMIEGTRVDCIIGATRIRDFSTATEVLQSRVMTFVNQIAEIVHGVVDEFHGYASKNNGDFFLLIWRKPLGMDSKKAAKLADMSMLAFTRILGAVHRSPVLAAYRGHPGLQQRLGKHCRVNLSSGLHYGWAIEGAVGSEFKIDASYLSPNVSIAESVERATQIYGVSIIVAESVIRICSQAVAAKCRLIDRVTITGSVTPMELYAIDLDCMGLTVEPPPQMRINWTSKQRFRVRQFLEAEKASKWHEDNHMVQLFNENPEIAAMRFRYTLEFIHVFNMGYQNYSQGEWQVAQRLLSRTRTMLGAVDGPSMALLRFMEFPHNYKAPAKWGGFRDLSQAHLQ